MKKYFNTFFLVLTVFLFTSIASNAQEAALKPLTSEAIVLKGSEKDRVISLMFNSKTVYIIGSEIIGEANPTKAKVEAGDFGTLFQNNVRFNSVELLVIKISEKNQIPNKLDLSKLSSFDNLEYIVVECHFDCSPSSIKNMFSDLKDHIVFFSVSIPR